MREATTFSRILEMKLRFEIDKVRLNAGGNNFFENFGNEVEV